ncbi:MAG TPA: hypothetical protein VGK35_14445 [Actinotalea sp.]|jgi:hypothetical protein
MTATVRRGWLVAALVVALILLLGSVALVATNQAQRLDREASSRSEIVPRWGPGEPGRPGMMGRDDRNRGPGMMGRDDRSTGRADGSRDCLDIMRGQEGS